MGIQAEVNEVQRRILEKPPVERIGCYDIVRKIAQGTFASVYLAVHIFTKVEVVIKSTEKSQLTLASEIANMRTCSHPHIIRLYEIIFTGERVWLVMEYCNGQELFYHLLHHGKFSEKYALSIISQLCGALAYIHRRHCAHRDLKLENVLLDERTGNVKLADFGLTRNYSSSKGLLETICGTGPYMAPELFTQKKYIPESIDIWSLGVIFYAMLYGRLPFEEDSDDLTKHKIVSNEPAYPDLNISEPTVDLLKAMLSKEPKARPRLLEILGHPALQPFAEAQIAILSKPEPVLFSTTAEKKLLKAMRTLHMDWKGVIESVESSSCDSLYGFWATALEKQRERHPHTRRNSSSSLRGVARIGRALANSPTLNKAGRLSNHARKSKPESIHSQLNYTPREASPKVSMALTATVTNSSQASTMEFPRLKRFWYALKRKQRNERSPETPVEPSTPQLIVSPKGHSQSNSQAVSDSEAPLNHGRISPLRNEKVQAKLERLLLQDQTVSHILTTSEDEFSPRQSLERGQFHRSLSQISEASQLSQVSDASRDSFFTKIIRGKQTESVEQSKPLHKFVATRQGSPIGANVKPRVLGKVDPPLLEESEEM